MIEISKKAAEFSNVEDVKKALKSLQTIKCRLKKQKARKDYEVEMQKVLVEEQILKEVRQYMEPQKLTVTVLTAEEIKLLDAEETTRAIKSIQSKKCLNKYQPESEAYITACKIEALLIAHRETVQEVPVERIRKTDLLNIIEDARNAGMTAEELLQILEGKLQ
jgi:2-succinyl-5-enolpyruvyl-6-hydroxy-3-cyclohexene-1-carboxylate synthase